jgi:hypothetical protein
MSRATLQLGAAFARRYGMDLRVPNIPIDYPLQGRFNFHTPALQKFFSNAAEYAQHGQLWKNDDRARQSSLR